MYPNVVTKILLESAPNALFTDIFIIIQYYDIVYFMIMIMDTVTVLLIVFILIYDIIYLILGYY